MKEKELKLIKKMLQRIGSTMKRNAYIVDMIEMDVHIWDEDIPQEVDFMLNRLIEDIKSNNNIKLDTDMDIVFELLQKEIEDNWGASEDIAKKLTSQIKNQCEDLKLTMSLRELRTLALSDSIESYIEFDEYVINWCDDNTIDLYLDNVQYLNVLIQNK